MKSVHGEEIWVEFIVATSFFEKRNFRLVFGVARQLQIAPSIDECVRRSDHEPVMRWGKR